MRDFRINWAVVLALIVLLGFTYFSFMGVLYNNHVNGDLLKGSLYAFGVILIVSICVVIMCVSKATRWKEIGTAGQIFFALIILAVFGFSAIPFTGFMKAIESKDEIQAKIDQTKIDADNIDQTYNDFVKQRIIIYDEWLRSDPSRYENAGGSTAEIKISNLITSLKNHLKPQSLLKCQAERREWLSKIEGMSVWNIMLPKNLKILGESTQKWSDDYLKLSNISYGDDLVLFKYKSIDDNPLEELGKIHISGIAVIAALLAFFFMLLPYIVTESFYGGRTIGKKHPKKHHNVNQPTVEDNDYE